VKPLALCLACLIGGAATAARASSPALDPAFVGTWNGSAEIVVNWTQQRTLPVEVTIAADGTVTGKVGDAEIVDGRFRRNRGPIGRALHLGTDTIITGRLRGAVIASEDIARDSFTMPLNWRDGAFAGGVHAGRNKVGGRETMMLSATHMRLIRDDPPGTQ
jgi:hypothetical protein